MKFEMGGFEVTVICGRPEVKYHSDGNGNYRQVTFQVPEALIHPAFKREFEEYVVKCLKMHKNKVALSERAIDAGLMRYVPPRIIRSGYSAYTFRKLIESRVGDVEGAKDAWDYNRAPEGAVKTGKFGEVECTGTLVILYRGEPWLVKQQCYGVYELCQAAKRGDL